MNGACTHQRQLVFQARKGPNYVECLDCGANLGPDHGYKIGAPLTEQEKPE